MVNKLHKPVRGPVPTVRATPRSALALAEMPTSSHFVRDHFGVPALGRHAWRIDVHGLVENRLTLELRDLLRLQSRSLNVTLECAGHRRNELTPSVPGIAWEVGAVSEARWTGASLADVLERARPLRSATAVVLRGVDRGPVAGVGEDVPFARALPIDKALDPDTLLAVKMNGEPIPALHGGPVRAIVPGWYATDSVKWLVSIEVVERPFEGHFEATDYRVPSDTGGTERLTALPVHALVLDPEPGARLRRGTAVARGIAWGGKGGVAAIEVALDDGPWRPADVDRGAGPYARVRWSFAWEARPGLRTLAVRATDGRGRTQPERPPWNPGGYGNSSIHRVSVVVT